MKTIGITGGVGAGKSTVLAYLEEKYNAFVIQADEVGHIVMAPGQECYQPVIDLFGKDVIKNDKTIDRKRVSDVVFEQPDFLSRLNGIIHPAVKRYILKSLEEQAADTKRKLESMGMSAAEISEKTGSLADKTRGLSVGIAAVGAAALATIPATEEFRDSMSMLESNVVAAGASMDFAQEAFKRFHAVSGEIDSSVEALSNLLQTSGPTSIIPRWNSVR